MGTPSRDLPVLDEQLGRFVADENLGANSGPEPLGPEVRLADDRDTGARQVLERFDVSVDCDEGFDESLSRPHGGVHRSASAI
jgi:hypothetical protein